MLENHGASTPQVYPQEDDIVVFAYDPDAGMSDERAPIVDVVFSDTIITAGETLTFSFTALRPVRVAYQIVYRRDGRWQFDEAELIYDEAERFTAFGDLAGAILPGRKERSITLSQQSKDHLYGYVLVQVLSLENGTLTMQTGHVITVTPETGEPELRVRTPEHFRAGGCGELPVFVAHSLPCALSVTVLDLAGNTVKRLSYRSPTRAVVHRTRRQLLLLGRARPNWGNRSRRGLPGACGSLDRGYRVYGAKRRDPYHTIERGTGR